MQSAEPVLRVENLTKHFPQVLALDRVCLDIRKGEIHCLLGENGAGKSTLAECVYGFFRPDSGSIYVKGRLLEVNSPAEAILNGIGMVHQHFVLIEPLSVIENIVLGLEGPGLQLDLSQSEARLQALCREYEVDLDLHAKIWQLSVGQQQWVEILKALFVHADLLILDEPTAVLTPQESDNLFAVLQKMKQAGLSILLITHKLQEVIEVSDRVTVLRKGRHITTVETHTVDKKELARLMVGHEVAFSVEKEPMPARGQVLEIRDLEASDDFGRKTLHRINLCLQSGEILGIAGVSGNGQKELSEALIGLRKPLAGQIFLNGKEVTGMPVEAIQNLGLAHIPQDRIHEGLIMEFTVAENLVLGLLDQPDFHRYGFLKERNIQSFARQCIQKFEIATPSPQQSTQTLSGGNLQKVILARELSQNPRCLIANKPTRGLDVGAIEYVHQQLLEQRRLGAGILLISEDLDEIFALSDRIAVIYKGKILGEFLDFEAEIGKVGYLMAGIKD